MSVPPCIDNSVFLDLPFFYLVFDIRPTVLELYTMNLDIGMHNRSVSDFAITVHATKSWDGMS